MTHRSPGKIASGHPRNSILRNGIFAAAAFAMLAAAPMVRAQDYERPPGDIGGGQASSGDESSSLTRINRLEDQVRALSGQVEQLQFQNKRLEDQLRKFQMDVDSRFQENSGRGGRPQRRSDAPEAAPAGGDAPQQAAQLPEPAAPTDARGRHGDAFDPNVQPAAPGAPLALGSPDSASHPEERPAERRNDPNGPLDLTPPSLRDQAAVPAAPIARLEPAAPAAAPYSGDPVKAEYDAAAEQLKGQHYDAAQQAFSAFVQKNPHSRLIAPAIYRLGESYYYQSRHREAAEQFLKIATDFSKSSVAPDAMIKLGVSLNALGAKDQACAFFSELPRKYPRASAAEKMAAAREARKASC